VIVDSNARHSLSQLLRDYHKELVSDQGMDIEVLVLEGIRELRDSGGESSLSIREISNRFIEQQGEDREQS